MAFDVVLGLVFGLVAGGVCRSMGRLSWGNVRSPSASGASATLIVTAILDLLPLIVCLIVLWALPGPVITEELFRVGAVWWLSFSGTALAVAVVGNRKPATHRLELPGRRRDG
jgi:hypothetical protein